jgi:hypothetical protein
LGLAERAVESATSKLDACAAMALICDNNHKVSCEKGMAVTAEKGASGVSMHLCGVARRGAIDARFVFRGDAAEALAEENNVTL